MTPEAAFAALAALVDAPEHPTRPRKVSWVDFERENGFAAPTDYRLLLEHFGVGTFGTSVMASLGGWLYLLDPFHPQQPLVDQSGWERRNARGLQRRFPEQGPRWPIWPEPGGLLPWGGSIDGDLVGWWTAGVPDEWGTRFFGRHDDFYEFPFGVAEFVVRMLRGELGALSLDRHLHPVDAGETPQFFPSEVQRPPTPHREDVTVRFAGLASAIDPASGPSSAGLFEAKSPEEMKARLDDYWQRFAEVMRPANESFEAWRPAAERAGLLACRLGHASGTGGVPPLHHELTCSFEPSLEPTAKRLVLELAEQLGVAIADVRDLEYERIWVDISSPRSRPGG